MVAQQVVLPPHSSSVPGLILCLGYCLCWVSAPPVSSHFKHIPVCGLATLNCPMCEFVWEYDCSWLAVWCIPTSPPLFPGKAPDSRRTLTRIVTDEGDFFFGCYVVQIFLQIADPGLDWLVLVPSSENGDSCVRKGVWRKTESKFVDRWSAVTTPNRSSWKRTKLLWQYFQLPSFWEISGLKLNATVHQVQLPGQPESDPFIYKCFSGFL